jgi:transposase
MLVLFCVQVVQTSNNECSWGKKTNKTSKRYPKLSKKQNNLVNKIHKLIIKEPKLNVHRHIKTGRNHILLQV